MKLKLNGEVYDAGCARNVSELVSQFALPAEALLVEHNGLALRRAEWGEHELSEGDQIEVIRIVAGG